MPFKLRLFALWQWRGIPFPSVLFVYLFVFNDMIKGLIHIRGGGTQNSKLNIWRKLLELISSTVQIQGTKKGQIGRNLST